MDTPATFTVKDLLAVLNGVPEDTPMLIEVPMQPNIYQRRDLQYAQVDEIKPGVFRVVVR